MFFILENSQLKASFKTKGAELYSLILKNVNLEIIWQADAAFWPRHTPVLFPIVGKLLDNTYTHQNHKYHLPQHGFARDKEFTIYKQSQDELVFSLKSDSETLKIYPFHFEFRISYSLKDYQLEVGYEVINLGKEDMFFSVGAHPAFCCPLLENEHFEDYYLEFEKPEVAESFLLNNGNFSGVTKPVLNQQNTLSLSYNLFADDALVFKNLKSKTLTLKSKRNPHEVKMSFEGFPYMGIWTKGPGAKFVCLEAWLGLSDSVSHSGKIEEKEGIIKLNSKSIFMASYFIEVK